MKQVGIEGPSKGKRKLGKEEGRRERDKIIGDLGV